MSTKLIVITIVIGYLIVTTGVGLLSIRRNKSASQLMTAKNSLGPFVIGFLLMSEFLGTGGFMGTPQKAFTQGMYAAMAMISISIGFLFYAFCIAPKYKDSGQYTISGILQAKYGTGVRYAASILMIFALMVDTVSNYTGGAIALEEVLGVNVKATSLILAVLVALAVAGGGLHGMGITNLIHIVVKYAALIIIAVVAWNMLQGDPTAQQRIPPAFYTVEGTGLSQLFSWTIANIGAVFATQYVMQSITALRTRREAIGASVIASITLIPTGMLGAFIGVAARGLFPDIKSAKAIPVFFNQLPPVTAGIVTAGIVAAALVSLSALVIGATTLIMKDFYVPFVKSKSKDSKLAFRVIAVVLCLLPLPFVWFVPDILGVVFLSRSLRAAIGVVVVFMFYLPSIGRGKGVLTGLLTSLVGTTIWYSLDEPFGVDSTYVAIGLPIVCMLIDGLATRVRTDRTASPEQSPSPALEEVSK